MTKGEEFIFLSSNEAKARGSEILFFKYQNLLATGELPFTSIFIMFLALFTDLIYK